jgi:tetrapyrrole methylase family protein/MazG family protein
MDNLMDFSLISSLFDTLRIPPPPRLILLDASTLASAHVPPYPPDMPALLVGVDSAGLAAHLKEVLSTTYPSEHEVRVVESGVANQKRIGELENSLGGWFLPPLGEGTSFESFAEVVAHLRAPNGCPWDKEQTHESLRKHLLEEAYEAISAIDSGDFAHMREEFGDLLLQIVLQAQIANEERQFNVNEVIRGIHAKIVRRHPHVFGDLKLDGVDEVLANWEKLKEQERGKTKEERGILDGVPFSLPALSQAQEYQDRAARVGFDWKDIDGVLDKLKEEVEEVKNAETDFELASEIGDLFFALVNVARWKNVDAESALRATNAKFKKRFAHVEHGAKQQGRNLSELSLEEMESLWQEAKKFD